MPSFPRLNSTSSTLRRPRRAAIGRSPDLRRFEAVVEGATGRKVVGFMSGNQQDPDVMCEVFILESADSAA